MIVPPKWHPFLRVVPQDLQSVYIGPKITSPVTKDAHELRLLGILLPGILSVTPLRVLKRESPDFEITTHDGSVFVEIVDAIPDAVSSSGTMNLAKRRSRASSEPYHVAAEQFVAVIAREIEGKRRKASRWQQDEPELRGRLMLLVNGGQGPMQLRDYCRSVEQWQCRVPPSIDPFVQVAVGDETGAFVCR
jgi:hypothetical protein